MYEKTELEKRWDEEEEAGEEVKNPGKLHLNGAIRDLAEEEQGGCGGACRCNEPCENASAPDDEEEEALNYVLSPLSDEKIPMVLITDNNRVFIGGLIDFVSGGILLDFPMVYLEIPDPKSGQLQIGIQKIYHGQAIPENMWFKHDTLYMLRLDARAFKLAKLYAESINAVRLAEAGLEAPSMAAIEKINNG